MRTKVVVVCACLAVSCGSGTEPPGESVDHGIVVGGPIQVDGLSVPPPGGGEIQFVSRVIEDIMPGDDVTLCEYLDWQSDEDYDITDYAGFQSQTGHHVILFAVPVRQPIDLHRCTETDMINVRYLAAGGNEAGRPDMPPGVVMRLSKGMQLMIQSHWINTLTQPVDGQSALNVEMAPASPDSIVAGLFTAVTTDIQIPGSVGGTAHAECAVGEDMTFFTLGGHMHEHGTQITISFAQGTNPATQIYQAAWEAHFAADPPRNSYTLDAPFIAKQGDRFTVDCQYANTSDAAITFPAEMCVMWGYHYPATREINCVNGAWPPAP